MRVDPADKTDGFNLRARLDRTLIGVDFRRLWLAQAFSSFGEYLFASTSTVWVAARLFPHSPRLPALIGAVILAAAIPRIVVGPLAGVYADRWRARKTMIVNDCLRVGLFVALLLVVRLGGLDNAATFAAIVICVVVSETSAQFFNPSRAAIMQLVIPEDRRVDAASMSMFSLTGVAIVATAAGPAVFGLFGAQVAIAACVATYAVSCVMTVRVRDSYRPERRVVGRFWRDFADGARSASQAPTLRVVLIGACFYGVSLGINSSVLALFGLKTLGLSPSHYGVLAMMFPLGNLISAVWGVRLIKRIGVHRAYLMALSALGLGYFAYACAGRLVIACLLMLVCGVIFSVYIMCQGPILQAAVPEGYMGRISAVFGPLVSMTSAVSTLFASQVLAFAGAHGIIAGDGGWSDPYRLLIMFGAAFLLLGGASMYVVQARSGAKRAVQAGGCQRSSRIAGR
ncbi:MFS transporter [Nocardia sp. NPDC056064]|uniref:MFS transporter n=1 Tax=Nocardia sp. NPDC056064 TaxID=3345701 RepID=UPI0035D8080B